MKKRIFIMVLISIFLVLLSGCFGKNEETPKDEDNGKDKVVEYDLKKFPLKVSEFSELEAGFVGDFGDLTDVEKDKLLKDVLAGKTEDSYMNLLSTFQQDYESVDNLLEKLKFNIDGFSGDGPNSKDRYAFKDNLNVLILLDASGSMGRKINGVTQMDIAKESIKNFTSSLPSEAKVGLRVYGHKGKGTPEDKELSCNTSELVFGMSKLDKKELNSKLDSVSYSGWTPTGLTFKKVLEEDLKGKTGDKNSNIIFLVSDGDSTCGDNPVENAKILAESDLSPVFNVLGFNVDASGKKELDEITQATNGVYHDVKNASQLTAQFKEVEKIANEWKEWLSNIDKELDRDSKLNLVDIFNYAARVQQNVVKTDENIDLALDYLKESGKLKEKEYNNLLNLHDKYIDEISEKVADLRTDLRNVNTENLTNAFDEVERLLYGDK